MTNTVSKSIVFNILNKEIGKISSKIGIDIACGDGKNNKYFKTKKYIGIDKDQKLIETCKKKLKKKNIIFIKDDIYKLYKIKKNAADLVVSTHTLSHIKKNRIKAIKNIISLVKSNGYFFCNMDIRNNFNLEKKLITKSFRKVKIIYYKNYLNYFIENYLSNKLFIYIYKLLFLLRIEKILKFSEVLTQNVEKFNKCVIFIGIKKIAY
jgi:ubiquinone/menaquinone biosynthesis C-methylase UbiE